MGCKDGKKKERMLIYFCSSDFLKGRNIVSRKARKENTRKGAKNRMWVRNPR